MKFFPFFSLAVSLIFIGCKKKATETIIKGNVFSEIEEFPVSGANVKFYIKSVNGNSFSSSFQLEEELNVGANGEFSFSFLKSSSDIEYKVLVNKSSYKGSETIINPANINAGEENEQNPILIPFGKVDFNIKSGPNSGLNDEFLFSFNNELSDGQSFVGEFYLGNQIDTTLNTEVVAEKYVRFSYVIKRNGQYLNVDDSVFCTKGTEVQKNILY